MIIFTEEFCQPENLHPFTLTRQIQDIRIGILTIREKWEMMLQLPSLDKFEDDYKDLSRSVQIDEIIGDGFIYMIHGNLLPIDEIIGDGFIYMIHGNLLPTTGLVKAIRKLKNGEFIATPNGNSLVFRISKNEIKSKHKIKVGKAVTFSEFVYSVQYPWDIFQLNDWAIRQDFNLLKGKRKSKPISKTNNVINPSHVFIEKGAKVEYATINADAGPVYIGKDAEIMEGCLIRGPFSMGEKACLKMGSKVYGATTLGPYCIGGGEIKNSVLFGYSNKAHDGYLGDAVIGEWCNLGGGTTNSNVKNNAGEIKIWTTKGELNAGMKCGVFMGDYSRTAINTSINTGTIIGVSCNVFGNGLTPKFIPSFSWGNEGLKRYDFEKSLEDIKKWKKLKGKMISDEEITILRHIFEKF